MSDPASSHLYCPQCDYDLTGLPELRCPECGATFDRAAIEAEKASAATLTGAGRSVLMVTAYGFVLGLLTLALELLEWPPVLGLVGVVVFVCYLIHHAHVMAKRVCRASAAQRNQTQTDLSEFLIVLFGVLIADVSLGIIGVGIGLVIMGVVLYLIQSLVLVR